jgi:uncharacterized protein (DUF697 family)
MAETQDTVAGTQTTTAPPPIDPANTVAPALDPVDRSKQIISKYEKWAAGMGLVPLPLFDAVSIGAVQLKMVQEIAEAYGFKVKDHAVKTLLAGFLGAHASANLGFSLGTGIAKLVPGVGTVLGMAFTPAIALASTRAIGMIFSAHFASGGTLLNFDAKAAREQFVKLTAKS